MDDHREIERKTQLRAVISFLIILGVIILTVIILFILVANKRVAKEEEKVSILPAIVASTVTLADYTIGISTQGVVESTRQTTLAAEVGGRVMEISPNLKQGGTVSAGERLVQIDPSDYRSALAGAEVTLAEVALALEQERARVQQAQLDWKKLGQGNPATPLVLRAPQLAAAEARTAAARELVNRAQRDLERTEILAPFAAGVRLANAEVGAVAAPGVMVAELYATDSLEVRLPLSLEDFGSLQRGGDGQVSGAVSITGKIGTTTYTWQATPSRLDPEINRKTLSGNLFVKIQPTPGSLFPLPPIGLFVQAQLGGQTLRQVAEIPRRAILEGSQVILVDSHGKITFRPIQISRLTAETAVIHSGLAAGDRIVLTRLTAPVADMEVAIETPEAGP